MNFLIQTINGQIVHDFAFELLQSIPFIRTWRGEDPQLCMKEGTDFKDITDPDKHIPVGSVEFVSEYLKAFYPHAKKALRPLNVPECLFPFAGRKICNVYWSGLYGFRNTSKLPYMFSQTWAQMKLTK